MFQLNQLKAQIAKPLLREIVGPNGGPEFLKLDDTPPAYSRSNMRMQFLNEKISI
jgi:hypothetical protein